MSNNNSCVKIYEVTHWQQSTVHNVDDSARTKCMRTINLSWLARYGQLFRLCFDLWLCVSLFLYIPGNAITMISNKNETAPWLHATSQVDWLLRTPWSSDQATEILLCLLLSMDYCIKVTFNSFEQSNFRIPSIRSKTRTSLCGLLGTLNIEEIDTPDVTDV